jgi:hypothetical protein
MNFMERLVAACDHGEGYREQIAQGFCVGTARVCRLLLHRGGTPRPGEARPATKESPSGPPSRIGWT